MKTPVIPNIASVHAKPYLLAGVAAKLVALPSGHVFGSIPFLAGETIDLIGISNIAELFTDGVIDNTDCLDEDVQLDTIYVHTQGVGSVAIDVSQLEKAKFEPSVESNHRDRILYLHLNFNGREIKVYGQINLETGAVIVSGNLDGYTLKAYRGNSNRR